MKAIILYSTLSPHCDIATYKEHKTNTNSVFIRHEVVECETLEDALDMATPLSRVKATNVFKLIKP